MQETWVWFLGWEDPLEEGKATHSSILAWRIPMTVVHGVAKSQTRLRDFHFQFHIYLYIYLSITSYLSIHLLMDTQVVSISWQMQIMLLWKLGFVHSVSSVTQWCLTLCNRLDCSMPGFPVHQQLPELAQTHVHRVGDAIKPFYPLVLLPSIFTSIRVFFNESVLHIRCPK